MKTSTCEEFLKQANIVVLATVGPNGRPYAAPFWYLYEDGIFKINVGRESRTRQNVDHQPSVALVIDRRELPYYSVKIRGTAEIRPQLDSTSRVRLAERYLGPELAAKYIARRPIVDAVMLKIRVEKVSEYRAIIG
jgi:PPOX class probable F420-dependent enzyme